MGRQGSELMKKRKIIDAIYKDQKNDTPEGGKKREDESVTSKRREEGSSQKNKLLFMC